MARSAEEVMAIALRIIVGGVFVYAGLAKAIDPARFALDVDNFRLTKWPLSCALALYLPWLEILAGSAWILGVLRAGASLLLGAMLLAFLAVLTSAWMRGLDISCGCFGQGGVASLRHSLALDLALVAALAFVILLERRRCSALARPDAGHYSSGP